MHNERAKKKKKRVPYLNIATNGLLLYLFLGWYFLVFLWYFMEYFMVLPALVNQQGGYLFGVSMGAFVHLCICALVHAALAIWVLTWILLFALASLVWCWCWCWCSPPLLLNEFNSSNLKLGHVLCQMLNPQRLFQQSEVDVGSEKQKLDGLGLVASAHQERVFRETPLRLGRHGHVPVKERKKERKGSIWHWHWHWH